MAKRIDLMLDRTSHPSARRSAQQTEKGHVWHPWSPVQEERSSRINLDHGSGYHVWDTDGKRYVDAVSAAMNNTCGYGETRVVQAVTEQLSRLPHFDLSAGGHEVAVRLAERLAELLPGGLSRTFFTNSGSEAAEAAVRIAVNFWTVQQSKRNRIVTFADGYHGTTALTQHLSGLPALLQDLPVSLPVTRVPLPVSAASLRQPEALQPLLDAFSEAIRADDDGADVAAVMIEPLLNVGGGIILPTGFLSGLKKLCDEAGTLLILDEVFTGFGRTGRMFAFEAEHVVPDLLVMSKGISSGYLPLGAVTTHDEIFRAFRSDPVFGGLRYGHTTSGHAACCAASLAVLDILRDDQLIENAHLRGKELLTGLSDLSSRPEVVDVRGDGLVIVVELHSISDANQLLLRAREQGLLLRCQQSSLLAIPPLMIDEKGVEEIVDMFGRAMI